MDDLGMNNCLALCVLTVTVFTVFTSVATLTMAKVFLVCKSIQAGRIMETWVTGTQILMNKQPPGVSYDEFTRQTRISSPNGQ